MVIVNEPEVVGPLTWLYGGIVLFIAALGFFFTYLYLQSPRIEALVGLVVLAAVETLMLSLLASIYKTRYILTERELILKASRFIGGTKKIPLKQIESVKRTLIPFGFRLFGASFYGGYYYFPGLGKAFMVMTNFKDGVIIRSKEGNYIITPKNPESFIESIENRMKDAR